MTLIGCGNGAFIDGFQIVNGHAAGLSRARCVEEAELVGVITLSEHKIGRTPRGRVVSAC